MQSRGVFVSLDTIVSVDIEAEAVDTEQLFREVPVIGAGMASFSRSTDFDRATTLGMTTSSISGLIAPS